MPAPKITAEQHVKPASITAYVVIAVTGLVISVLAIYYYLHFIQGNVTNQVDQRIFYLILILFGISASAVVFGIMQSYAILKGETLNTRFKLTGPIVGVVLTVIGGFYLPKSDDADKTITVRVFDKNQNPVTNGDVKIYLEEYIRSQSIDKNGQAQFTGIPHRNVEKKVKVEVSSPGYATQQFDTVLSKTNTIELVLPLTAVVYITGQVKRANETPIKDVEINVDGTRYVTYSITNGTYRLRVDEYTLGDEIMLTTSHPQFEDKTRMLKINAPEIRDIDFVLQPVENN